MSRGGANGVKAMLEALQAKVDLNSATIEALQAQREEDRNTIEDLHNALATQGAELEGEITRQIMSVKDDLDHKFALQVAENKRLLHGLTKQKSDSVALREELNCISEKMIKLHDELLG